MPNAVTITINGDPSGGTAAFQQINKGLKNMQTQAQSAFANMKQHWLGYSAAVAAVSVTIMKAWEYAKGRAEADEIKQNLNALAAVYNTTAQQITASMFAASEGLIMKGNLTKAAMEGLGKGLTPEQVTRIAQYADAIAKLNNADPTETLNNLMTAIASGKEKAIKGAVGIAGLTKEWDNLHNAATKSEMIARSIDLLAQRGEQFKSLNGNTRSAADEMTILANRFEQFKKDLGGPAIKGIFFVATALQGVATIGYELIATFVQWKETGQITILALSAGIEKMLSWIYAGLAAFDRLASKAMTGKAKQEAIAAAADEKKRSEEFAAAAARDIADGSKLIGITKERAYWENKALESNKKAAEYRKSYRGANGSDTPSAGAISAARAGISANKKYEDEQSGEADRQKALKDAKDLYEKRLEILRQIQSAESKLDTDKYAEARDRRDKWIEESKNSNDVMIAATQWYYDEVTKIDAKANRERLKNREDVDAQIRAWQTKDTDDAVKRMQNDEKARVSIAQNGANAMVNVTSAIYELTGKQSREAFEAFKAMQIAQALMSTYTGATAAYAASYALGPAGIVLAPLNAAFAVASGLANVALISAQQPPKMHTGGIVGQPGTTSDEVLRVLQKGEGVIDARTMSTASTSSTSSSGITRADLAEFASMIVSGFSSAPAPVIDRAVIFNSMTHRTGQRIIQGLA